MNTSIIVGSIALALAGVLATGHAFGQETPPPLTKETAHEKRKADFARNCIKPGLSEPQLEACRAAYRRL